MKLVVLYSHSDGEGKALAIAEALRAEGHDVFLDKLSVGRGKPWRLKVEDELESCDYVMPVITRNARKAKWFRKEIAFAESLGKRIIAWRVHAKAVMPLEIADQDPIELVQQPGVPIEKQVRAALKGDMLDLLKTGP